MYDHQNPSLKELEKRDVREVNTMRTLTRNEMECASGGLPVVDDSIFVNGVSESAFHVPKKFSETLP